MNGEAGDPTAARERAERLAQRTEAKLVREREASAAKLARRDEKLARQAAQADELRTKVAEARTTVAQLRSELTERRSELAELRGSYYLSGADKKLDIRELDGFSAIAQEIVAAGRTAMHFDRLFTLWQAVGAAPPDRPVIEIGSYLGGSARFIADALQAAGRTPPFYVCDTFVGHAQTDAAIDTSHHGAGKFEDASAEGTAAYLSGYPGLELVVGDIVQTSSRFTDESFGLVHLDVDVYPTTAFCLAFFAPRLTEGALMVIDDYATTTCPGVKRAADEFVARSAGFRLWHLLTGQALLSRIA